MKWKNNKKYPAIWRGELLGRMGGGREEIQFLSAQKTHWRTESGVVSMGKMQEVKSLPRPCPQPHWGCTFDELNKGRAR